MLGRSKDNVGGKPQHNIWLYRAASWNSTYEWVNSTGVNGAINVGNGKLPTEDPTLWKGRRGFHAIFHSHPDLTHAWSADGLAWNWSPQIIGPSTQEGGDNERPRVVVDSEGDLAVLFAGQLVVPGQDGSRTSAFVPN